MNNNIMEIYDQIVELFDEEKQSSLYDLFDSIQFKLNRNYYHLNNIKKIISKSKNVEQGDYYHDIHLPIYYEIESFLVSLRSSVDMFLHLINFSFNMRLSVNDVNLYNVYRNDFLPKAIKNIFDRYTRPYNNPTWNFIYTFRNEIVHEKSIHQVLPVTIDLFSSSEPLVYFKLEDADREMIGFFNNCLRFLDTFSMLLLDAIRVSL